jgi:hypothetical protein
MPVIEDGYESRQTRRGYECIAGYVVEQETANFPHPLCKLFRFVSADNIAISRVLAAEAQTIIK